LSTNVLVLLKQRGGAVSCSLMTVKKAQEQQKPRKRTDSLLSDVEKPGSFYAVPFRRNSIELFDRRTLWGEIGQGSSVEPAAPECTNVLSVGKTKRGDAFKNRRMCGICEKENAHIWLTNYIILNLL
jgi:hypothetical protein